MKRAFEILSVALFLLLMPVLAAQPLLPRPYVDPFGGMALAVQPDEMLADPALEARARALSAGLRCLVCQNQSIDDSDADLARDLRLLVRERLKAGDSDRAAVDYIVARYGEFVLLKPRFETVTLLLWGTPLVLLLGGAALALGLSRRRSPSAAPRLSEAEERAVEKVLADRGL